MQEVDKWFVVFDGIVLLKLTKNSEEACKRFRGVHEQNAHPATTIYTIKSLDELAILVEKLVK